VRDRRYACRIILPMFLSNSTHEANNMIMACLPMCPSDSDSVMTHVLCVCLTHNDDVCLSKSQRGSRMDASVELNLIA
jgi:hypothetical protein